MRLLGFGLSGVVLTGLLCGCYPSLAKVSSGHVGCSPNDVVVSDQERSATGLDTWLAECQGRKFSCARLGPDTSCTELADGTEPSGTKATRAETKPAETNSARGAKPSQPLDGAAPEGVAGFTFGTTQEEARTACEGAGYDWKALSSDRYVCGGPAKEFALPVRVALQFCEAKACAVTLVHRPEQSWYKTFQKLRDTLEKKYGHSVTKEVNLGDSCTSDNRMPKCLLHAAASAHYRWRWHGGQSVALIAERPTPELDGEQYPSLRLHYSTAAAQSKSTDTKDKLELDL